MIRGLSMMPAVSAPWWTSRAARSHATVDNALKIVEKLEHRAGKDAAGKTGDGVGYPAPDLPPVLLSGHRRSRASIWAASGTTASVCSSSRRITLKRNQAKKMFEIIVEKEGMKFLGWRKVPIQPDMLGEKALSCMPYIEQGFVERPADLSRGLDFDRTALCGPPGVRAVQRQHLCGVPAPAAPWSIRACSWSASCGKFYPDLQDADYESAIAMVHSRFSTNTNPSWERAHPNRFILHNGEINTIRGNADRMLAREETMSSAYMSADDLDKVLPVVNAEGSDSAMLDNTLEFLVMNGMPLPLAVMVCHSGALEQR